MPESENKSSDGYLSAGEVASGDCRIALGDLESDCDDENECCLFVAGMFIFVSILLIKSRCMVWH